MRLLLLLAALASTSSVSPCQVSAAKPVLEVWSSSNCRPCLQFWADYRGDASFRNALDRSYDVRGRDYCANMVEGRLKMVFRLPTFLGRVRVEGYTSADDLLARLGLQRIQPRQQIIPPPARPEPDPRPPSDPTIDQLKSQIGEVNSRLDDLAAAISVLLKRKSVSGERGPIGPRGPEGAAGRDGANWDRPLVRSWVRDEVSQQILPAIEEWQIERDELLRVNAEMSRRIEQLENRPATTGPAGPAGVLDVVITDSGRVVNRHQKLRSGSTVVVDINRFKKGLDNGSK